jgi:hypothetical protein
MVQHDVLNDHQNGNGLVMTTMKITLDAAMRARDVSPPGPVDNGVVGDDVVDGGAVSGDVVDDVPHAATRDGAQP